MVPFPSVSKSEESAGTSFNSLVPAKTVSSFIKVFAPVSVSPSLPVSRHSLTACFSLTVIRASAAALRFFHIAPLTALKVTGEFTVTPSSPVTVIVILAGAGSVLLRETAHTVSSLVKVSASSK